MLYAESLIISDLWASNQLDKANSRLDKFFIDLSEYKNDNKIAALEGTAYYLRGNINIYENNLPYALENYRKAVEVYGRYGSEVYKQLSDTHYNMSILYMLLGEYDSGLYYNEAALNTDLKLYGDSHIRTAQNYITLSQQYELKGFFQKSLDYLNKAEVIIESNNIHQGPNLFKLLHAKATIYSHILELDKALEYALRALKVGLITYEEDNNELNAIYISTGTYFYEKDLLDSSLYYYNKAIGNIQKSNIDVEQNLQIIYNNIGYVYLKQNRFDKAIEYYDKAVNLQEQFINTGHPKLAKYYRDLASAYYIKGDIEEGEKYLDIAIKKYGSVEVKDSELSECYNLKGEFAFEDQDYNNALKNYQKAIYYNSFGVDGNDYKENPYVSNYLSRRYMYKSLIGKASVLSMLFRKTRKEEYLLEGLKVYEICDSMIVSARFASVDRDDRVFIQGLSKNMYAQAINLNLLGYEFLGEQKFLEKAFYYIQKSKSVILQDVLANNSNQNVSKALAGNLSDLERELEKDVAFYEKLLNDERVKQEALDSPKLDLYSDKLFVLNKRYDSLKQQLEKQFPSYYQIKYDNSTIRFKEIQKTLDAADGVIDYFVSDSSSYAVFISREKFDILRVDLDNSLSNDINDLRALLSQESLFPASNNSYDEYLRISYNLYKKLFSPLEDAFDTTISNISIIPDGQIGYLPFELLIKEIPLAKTYNYGNLAYLLRDYNINYGYSSKLLFGNEEALIPEYSLDYLGYAPTYSNEFSDSTSFLTSQLRGPVGELKWNRKEVSTISSFVKGQAYFSEAATENEFKRHEDDAMILHLAMHALVDDNDPLFSKLVFTRNNDGTEDGYLHTFELYNMNLSARIVVLSACETGYGKLEKGEGIISLARAFRHAGVPSIVMSHWKVDDRSTGELMSLFYKNLANDMSKSEALRIAKLEMLENADPLKSHPFYWGSFVVMGDNTRLEFGKGQYQIYWGILSFVAIAAIIIIYTLIKRNKESGRNSTV